MDGKPLVVIVTDVPSKITHHAPPDAIRMHITAIARSGGLPVLVSPLNQADDIVRISDAILLVEGPDVHPKFYGGDPTPAIRSVDIYRDEFEIKLIQKAVDEGIPILGIGRGAQIINVALGGTLYQDINSEIPKAIRHDWNVTQVGPDQRVHSVRIKSGTILYSLLKETVNLMGTNEIFAEVNSFHHQAVKKLGNGLKSSASSIDGISEAIESEDGMIVGIQWNPEYLPEMKPLFDHLVEKAREARE